MLLNEFLEKSAELYPDKVALICRDKRFTFIEIENAANSLSNALCEKEDVIEAAVVGVEDEILGKAIEAFVHLTDTSRATEEDILRFCSERLEDFAVPKYMSLCRALPKTVTGKVKKRDLR